MPRARIAPLTLPAEPRPIRQIVFTFPPYLFNMTQAAAYIGMTDDTLAKRVKAGLIQPVYENGRPHFTRPQLEAYADSLPIVKEVQSDIADTRAASAA